MAFNRGQKPQSDRREFIFHSELQESSPIDITMDAAWREAPAKLQKCQFGLVDITIKGGDKRTYWCENEECAEFFRDDMVGQTLRLVCAGKKDDATIVEMQTGTQVANRQAAAPAQRTRAAAPAAAPPQAKTAAKWQPLGATVGMAVNNACQSLTHQGKPLNPTEVWEIASDLLAVSRRLEAGNLAPTWSERHPEPEAKQEEPAPAADNPDPVLCDKCQAVVAEDGSCPTPGCDDPNF